MCANASTIVKDGGEFCRMSGLPWVKGTGEKDSCFNPEDAAYSHVQIPIPRVGSKSNGDSSASTSSSSSASASSSSSSFSSSASSDADASDAAMQAKLRELEELRKQGWRHLKRLYRRATNWFRANPQGTALGMVVFIVLFWFTSWLYRRGICAAWARRIRSIIKGAALFRPTWLPFCADKLLRCAGTDKAPAKVDKADLRRVRSQFMDSLGATSASAAPKRVVEPFPPFDSKRE